MAGNMDRCKLNRELPFDRKEPLEEWKDLCEDPGERPVLVIYDM